MKINKMKLRFIIVLAIIGTVLVTKLVKSTFFRPSEGTSFPQFYHD